MDPALADRLCSVPLFADLERDHLRSVAALVQEFEVEAGLVMTHPGMVGAGLFLIEEGEVTLDLDGRQVSLGPGEMLGELALLDDRAVHTNRARAKTAVRGYCIARDDLAKLLHDEPKIALPMLKVVAKRLVDNLTTH